MMLTSAEEAAKTLFVVFSQVSHLAGRANETTGAVRTRVYLVRA